MKKLTSYIFTILFTIVLVFGFSLISNTSNVFASSSNHIKSYSKSYSLKKKNKVIAKGKFTGLKVKNKSKLANVVNSISNNNYKQFTAEWAEIKDYAKSLKPSADYLWIICETSQIGGDKNFISIETIYSSYSGGAHPLSFYSYDNIYKKSGKKVSLQKLAKCSIHSFNEKVISAIDKKFPTTEDKNCLAKDFRKRLRKRKFKDYEFYYKRGKLHIVFGEYEIGGYSLGMVDIIVK